MTKYFFFTLPLFLFCFITFDFSSQAFAADAFCAQQCAPGNKACINYCNGTSGSKTTTRSRQPAKATTPTKSNNHSCPERADVATYCEGRGWNPVECRCRTASEAASSTNNNGNQNQNDNPALAEGVNRCAQAKANALNSCDQDADTGMQGSQSALSNFAVSAGSMGMAAACSNLASLLAGANGAVVYFTQNCSSDRTTCLKTCDQARVGGLGTAQRASVESDYEACRGLDAKINQAKQAMQNMVGTIQGAAACSQATDTAVYAYCQSNPTAVGCAATATDCSNPQIAASNPICICKTNPTAAQCTGAQAKADFGGSADMSSNSSGISNAPSSGLNSDSLFSSLDYAGNGMTPSQGAAEDVGGKKGGSANLGDGGGSGAAGGEDGKGGGSAANALAVNSGFRGGGGGGGGWGGGYGSDSGDGHAYNPNNSQVTGANGPNLRDFLPNGKFDPKSGNRGLAGVSGPDGITGPHSDIWKKIQNRYQVQIQNAKVLP